MEEHNIQEEDENTESSSEESSCEEGNASTTAPTPLTMDNLIGIISDFGLDTIKNDLSQLKELSNDMSDLKQAINYQEKTCTEALNKVEQAQKKVSILENRVVDLENELDKERSQRIKLEMTQKDTTCCYKEYLKTRMRDMLTTWK